MPTAPLYRRDESVYLKSSAELGKLEAYKITSIKQVQSGRWVYRIDIGKKPPAQGMVGDTFDVRMTEPSLFYTEAELITVCEALDIICGRFRRQVEALELKVASRCTESDAPDVGLDEPRWGIGDFIYFAASARLGFLHHDCVQSIHEIGIQPGSRRTRYIYRVVNIPNKTITFREDELITFCEAADLALAACRRDLVNAEAKRAQLCVAGI
jgi:hypothetical protein